MICATIKKLFLQKDRNTNRQHRSNSSLDKNLMEYMAEKEKKENKAYTKTAPEFAVKKGVNEIQMIL